MINTMRRRTATAPPRNAASSVDIEMMAGWWVPWDRESYSAAGVNNSSARSMRPLHSGTQIVQHQPAVAGKLRRIAHHDLQLSLCPIVAQRNRAQAHTTGAD